MRYKPPDFKTLSEMAAIGVGRLTEDEARDIIESIRWPNGIMLCQRHNSINLSQARVVSQVFITGNRLPRTAFPNPRQGRPGFGIKPFQVDRGLTVSQESL